MKVMLNDKQVNVTGKTLREVIDRVNEGFIPQGEVITRIRLNGEELTEGVYSKELERECEGVNSLELWTTPIPQVIHDGLTQAAEYINRLVPGIKQIAELFRMGDLMGAQNGFTTLIDGLHWFILILEGPIEIMKLAKSDEFINCENRFATVLEKMGSAQEREDWVELADIMEYELVPAVEDSRKVIDELLGEVNKSL